MYLSIIIPTKNRAKILSKALESITKQTLSQDLFEVLVIDNGSIDNTKEVVENYKMKIKNLKYFYDKTPGLHTGRHRGLKESSYEILVYADDDIEAFPNWLEGIKESFNESNVVLVGGKNLPNYEENPPNWILDMWNKNNNDMKIIGYLSILDLGDEIKEINPYYVFGCNFSVKKNIVIEAGGFHPDGMPQELIKYRGDGETYISDYISKKGYKTIYNPKASIYHLVSKERMTLDYFKKRAFNQGISDSYSYTRNIKKTISKKSFIKLFMKNIILNLKIFLKKDIINTEIRKSYNKGFIFHQKEIIKDKSLLEWVLKDNYLE